MISTPTEDKKEWTRENGGGGGVACCQHFYEPHHHCGVLLSQLLPAPGPFAVLLCNFILLMQTLEKSRYRY
jgi:hypothetical protein